METWTLPSKVHKLIYKRKKHEALGYLSEITAINTGGVFAETDESYLRYVGYFRIQLLLEWGFFREALAWACLECELYPENNEVIFIKENIKQKIRNLPSKNQEKKSKTNFKSIWGKIAGMRELKAIIERDLILPFSEPEEYKKYNLQTPNGFLFYGPPGCGKTLIAKQIANILKFNFIDVAPSTTGSIYVHGTQNKIKDLFADARNKRPSLIFIDEVDAFAPNRTANDVGYHYQSEVNEMLIQLNNAFENGILVIAATNFKHKIDPAILRPGRIDKKIFVGPPDYEARHDAFKLYLEGTPHTPIRWDYLLEETENYTFAEIKYIVDEAKRLALEQSKPIDLNFLMKAVIENPPSLTSKELEKYLK